MSWKKIHIDLYDNGRGTQLRRKNDEWLLESYVQGDDIDLQIPILDIFNNPIVQMSTGNGSVLQYNFVNKSEIVINHNFGRYAIAQVFIDNELVICNIVQLDNNNIAIDLSDKFTGFVLVV